MLHHKSKTNSTLVNGEPSERILLAPGDLLQMGDVVIKIEKVDAQIAQEQPAKPLANEREEPEAAVVETQAPTNAVQAQSEPARQQQKFVWKPPEER